MKGRVKPLPHICNAHIPSCILSDHCCKSKVKDPQGLQRLAGLQKLLLQDELQHLEMTTGFSEGLRSHPVPRRCVKIKRPGKAVKPPKNGMHTGARLHINDSRPAAHHYAAGQWKLPHLA